MHHTFLLCPQSFLILTDIVCGSKRCSHLIPQVIQMNGFLILPSDTSWHRGGIISRKKWMAGCMHYTEFAGGRLKKKIKSDLRNMYVLLLLYGWRLHHCQWIHAELNSHDPCSDWTQRFKSVFKAFLPRLLNTLCKCGIITGTVWKKINYWF